jgi:hypothetical protein
MSFHLSHGSVSQFRLWRTWEDEAEMCRTQAAAMECVPSQTSVCYQWLAAHDGMIPRVPMRLYLPCATSSRASVTFQHAWLPDGGSWCSANCSCLLGVAQLPPTADMSVTFCLHACNGQVRLSFALVDPHRTACMSSSQRADDAPSSCAAVGLSLLRQLRGAGHRTCIRR